MNISNKSTKFCKEFTKYHFDEIELNYQTTIYYMLRELIDAIDLKHLSNIAELYKRDGNINNISVQLEDAILDTLINKRLIKNKKQKNKLII